MKNKRTFIRAGLTLFTILWMLFIFIMSGAEEDTSRAQSGAVCEIICQTFVEGYDQMSQDEQIALQARISFPVRKGAHLTEYAVLGALLALTAASFEIRGLYRGRGYALLTGLLYAVSDEIHQHFVPGRSCEIRDMSIDSSGVLLGVLLFTAGGRLAARLRTGRTPK